MSLTTGILLYLAISLLFLVFMCLIFSINKDEERRWK